MAVSQEDLPRIVRDEATSVRHILLTGPGIVPPEVDAAFPEAFLDPRVGFAYQDVRFCGHDLPMPEPTSEALWRDAPAIGVLGLRRDALKLLSDDELTIRGLSDRWRLLRAIASRGWRGVKVPGFCVVDRTPEIGCGSYYDYAQLRHEPVTVFCPLSGRRELWQKWSDYLLTMQWHGPLEFVFLDTSQDYGFFDMVRQWLRSCVKSDVRHCRLAVGPPGLASLPRSSSDRRVADVQGAMSQIWNWMGQNVTTPFVLTLEDDVTPQDTNVVEKLLRGLTPHVDSVSAAYQSATSEHWMAWDYRATGGFEFRQTPGEGLEGIGGNGFGCCLLRMSAVRDHVFSPGSHLPSGTLFEDQDLNFYQRLSRLGRGAKIDWRVKADHAKRS